MASTLTSPKKYCVHHHLCFRDVWSNFDSKQVVKSQEFCCRDDPQPTLFYLEVHFGVQGTNILSPFISSIGEDVSYQKQKVVLFDERWKSIRVAVCDDSGVLKKNFRVGWPEFYSIRPCNGNRPIVKWHLIFEFEYVGAKSKPTLSSTSPDPALHHDLGKLLTSQLHADVIFLVEGESIAAHKGVLSARCQYFERMFDSDVKENISNQIEVTDIDPAVFKEMLLFLYSGQPPKLSAVKTLNLLSAADKYGIESLKKVCESIVCDNLNSDIAVEALVLAKNISCLTLKEEATNYLKVNLACLID